MLKRKDPTILCIVTLLVFFLTSCNPKKVTLKEQSPQTKVCVDFLNNLYEGKIKPVINEMDEWVLESATQMNLDSLFTVFSNNLKRDYPDGIKCSFITSERTYNSKIPVLFIVIKVESTLKFGYYYFNIREGTNKVLLWSQFALIKDKRS